MEHLLWTEKYRPKKIDDCILPERLKKPFQEYVNQSNIPNLLLSGSISAKVYKPVSHAAIYCSTN